MKQNLEFETLALIALSADYLRFVLRPGVVLGRFDNAVLTASVGVAFWFISPPCLCGAPPRLEVFASVLVSPRVGAHLRPLWCALPGAPAVRPGGKASSRSRYIFLLS